MNISHSKVVDHFAPFAKEELGSDASALVVRLGHLGDVTLITGVLDYYGRTQQRKFDILTRSPWRTIFEGHPFVNNVISLPEGVSTFQEFSFFQYLAGQYRGKELIDLHGNLRTHLLRFLWKGKVCSYNKMSYARRLYGLTQGHFYGETLRKFNVSQRYAAAFEPQCHVPSSSDLLPFLPLKEDENQWARQSINHAYASFEGVKPIALHPFASHAPKTWSREKWQLLADLLDEKNIPWIVIGKGKDFFKKTKHNFINKTTLRETAALLAESNVLITGDSGPMHLATAVKTPVIALFGPTTKEWGFYPAGKHDRVLEPEVLCRPCSLHGKSSCTTPCIESINPEFVLNVISTMEQKFLP